MVSDNGDAENGSQTTLALVRRVQSSMLEAARSFFIPARIDDLRCLIRITVEFHEFLQNGGLERGTREVEYCMETVFSGISSFISVRDGYRCEFFASEAASSIKWDMISIPLLKEQFDVQFAEFFIEEEFEKKCRHLLDLFKIQLVLAGMVY